MNDLGKNVAWQLDSFTKRFGTIVTLHGVDFFVNEDQASSVLTGANELPLSKLGPFGASVDGHLFTFNPSDFDPPAAVLAPGVGDVLTWHGLQYKVSNVTYEDVNVDTISLLVYAYRMIGYAPLTGHTMDLWVPQSNVAADGEVSTETYTLAQAAMPCDLVMMSAQEKLDAGMDLTVQVGHVYVNGPTVTVTGGIPVRALLNDLADGIVWRVESYPTHFDFTVDFYELLVCQLEVPPAEIA